MFHGIRQVQKIMTSRSHELQLYLVFLSVIKNQLAKIDHKRTSIRKHILMTHHKDTNELIVKLMPSVEHESARLSLVRRFVHEESQMDISFENILAHYWSFHMSRPQLLQRSRFSIQIHLSPSKKRVANNGF